MLSAVLAGVVAVLAALWVWFQWTHRRLIRACWGLPPILPTIPILGHAHYTLWDGMEGLFKIGFDTYMDILANGVPASAMWIGPLPFILINRKEDIQTILCSSNTFEKGDEMSYMNYALGQGLLTAPAHIWKLTRRHMDPLFHSRNLEHMMPVFNRNCRGVVAAMAGHVDGAPLDVQHHVTNLALQSICNLLFGSEVKFDTQSEGFQCLKTVLTRVTDIFAKRLLYLWLRFDAIFNFLYKNELRKNDELWKTFSELPLKHTKANNAIKNKLKESGASYEQDGLNMLDVFSELQKKHPQFSEEHLKGEMMTLYMTGTESVSHLMAFSFTLLAQYRDVQEKLFEEVRSVVGLLDDVTSDHLLRMPYMDQVYKETLRWTSLVPFVMRKPAEDLKLSSCTVPAGTTVYAVIGGLSMDPKRFPDPLKFDPERFAPGNEIEKDRFAYLPFSGGPRSCIGKTYSRLLVKVSLAQVVRRLRLETAMDTRTMPRTMGVALRSTQGYNISLQERV